MGNVYFNACLVFNTLIMCIFLTAMHIAGYSTRNWIAIESQNYQLLGFPKNNRTQGLWTTCEFSAVYECCERLEQFAGFIPDFIHATRFFESVGLILCIILDVIVLTAFTVPWDQDSLEMSFFFTSILSGFSILLGIAIYGGRFPHEDLTSSYSLSYSFWLCTFSGVAYFPVSCIGCSLLCRIDNADIDEESNIPVSSTNKSNQVDPSSSQGQSNPSSIQITQNPVPRKVLVKPPAPILKQRPEKVYSTDTQTTNRKAGIQRPKTKADFVTLYKSEIFPPSNWTHYDDSKSIKDWNLDNVTVQLVPVNRAIEIAIRKLVKNSWDPTLLTKGKDAKGLDKLDYDSIEITKIYRIENPKLFEEYAHRRQGLFRKAQESLGFTKLENITIAEKGPIITTAIADKDLTADIFPEINEHYLFHGTRQTFVQKIAAEGLDNRLAGKVALGKGVYAAECPTKSDQYADDIENRNTTETKTLILVRMLLGDIYVLKKRKDLKRPPCKKCFSDLCAQADHTLIGNFDSVVADVWAYREFVVYDRHMCYPEYVLDYLRL